MSLVIGLAYRNQFVIVSNDSKVTLQAYNPDTLEPTDHIEDTEFVSEKVHPLTDKVLFSTTGHMFLGDLIQRELCKRVKPGNDLKECAEILQGLILDLRSGNVENLSEEEEGFLQFLGTAICINLFGFNHNGITGLVDYNPIDYKVEIIESSLDKKGYPAIIQSPNPEKDRQNMYPYLTLTTEEQTFNNFENSFLIAHTYLSSVHKGISTDCNFHVLFNSGKTIKYYKKTVETLDFYEQLGLIKPYKK
jgi:hypothetical protein